MRIACWHKQFHFNWSIQMNWNWAVSQVTTIINQSQRAEHTLQSFNVLFALILHFLEMDVDYDRHSRLVSKVVSISVLFCIHIYVTTHWRVVHLFAFHWKWSRKLKTVKNSTIDLAATNEHTHCVHICVYSTLSFSQGQWWNSIEFRFAMRYALP